MSAESLESLLGKTADPVAAGIRLRELAEDSTSDGARLLTELSKRSSELGQSDPAIVGGLLRLIHTLVLRAGTAALVRVEPAAIRRIQFSVPAETANQHLLLHLLAMMRTEASLTMLVDLLRDAPPTRWIEAGQVLSPLMQYDDWAVGAVYPALLQSLSQPSLAAPILDLANYLTRQQRVDEHPATDQLPMLNHLLGEVAGRLDAFEEDPRSFGTDVETVQTTLGEAVALAVSLCDAVGLIGDESSTPKLNQAVELRHRRVQCEAAGALARLGNPQGRQRLLELTADPAARLRAIHYADELGFGDSVEPQQRGETATAEAELSLWLSQPQQMGVPPTSVEVIDSRRILWPSFPDPVDVHLVRFEYNFGERQYSNVGITGPVTFTLSADVADLPIEDIYAMYAGWHAEHPDIFSVPADQFNESQRRAIEPLQEHLDRAGFETLQPALLGFFLDEQAAVFRAVRDGTSCLVVTDGLETVDLPVAGRLRPVSPQDIFNLYKGRKMLRTFNP